MTIIIYNMTYSYVEISLVKQVNYFIHTSPNIASWMGLGCV